MKKTPSDQLKQTQTVLASKFCIDECYYHYYSCFFLLSLYAAVGAYYIFTATRQKWQQIRALAVLCFMRLLVGILIEKFVYEGTSKADDPFRTYADSLCVAECIPAWSHAHVHANAYAHTIYTILHSSKTPST